MGRGRISFWCLSLAALFCAFLGVSAFAAADRSERVCSIELPQGADLRQVISGRFAWNCSGSYPDISAPSIVLRLPVQGAADISAAGLPRYAIGRNAKFSHLTIMAQGADGTTRQTRYAFDEVRPGLPNMQFSARLPQLDAGTRYVYVAVEGTTQRILLDRLHLSRQLPGATPADRNMLFLLAALSGMILMPLAFNLAFYRVLRERFLLWHVLLSTCGLAQILLTSGFYSAWFTLNMTQVRAVSILSFGGMLVTASMFAASFIEPDKLSPRLRKLLLLGAAWCALLTAIHAWGFESLGRHSSDLYYLGCAVMLPLFAAVICNAIHRGSRAVWFQLLGWAPMVLVGVVRVVSYFVPSLPQTDANDLFHLGIAVECVATAFGVADRFMSIRHQRDRAISDARMSEALSERDPLTGLLNRRAIEPRFAQLRSMGFNTFALIDLDRFKLVNDTHGHAVGDAVLQAVAHALEPNEDVLAMRLGGEEFMLLLRGEDTRRMAEQRRTAIPTRTAGDVPGLDRLVTASMGLVELPVEGLEAASFNDLYIRADELLYQAKEAGRNRAMFEKLVGFSDRRSERRPEKSVAA